ncbi:hypothetical protein GCM10027345_36670 [Hymenobacter daeguensis]
MGESGTVGTDRVKKLLKLRPAGVPGKEQARCNLKQLMWPAWRGMIPPPPRLPEPGGRSRVG